MIRKSLITVLPLLMALPAYSAISRVQSKSGSTNFAHTITVTFDSTTTTGNLIVVGVGGYYNADNPFTITDNQGNSSCYAAAKVTNPPSSINYHASIFYCANATGGASHAITVASASATDDYYGVVIMEYSGAATSSVLDGTGAAVVGYPSPATDYTTGNMTTTAANSLVIGVHYLRYGTTVTFTPGGTCSTVAMVRDVGTGETQVQECTTTSAGTYASSGTTSGYNGDLISHAGIAFKAVAAAPTAARRRIVN